MVVKTEILLGDEVKCKYTGLKGVALSKTEFINGCVQFGVSPKVKPGTQPSEGSIMDINIDSQSLVITKKGPGHKKPIDEEESTGGPSRLMKRRM